MWKGSYNLPFSALLAYINYNFRFQKNFQNKASANRQPVHGCTTERVFLFSVSFQLGVDWETFRKLMSILQSTV